MKKKTIEFTVWIIRENKMNIIRVLFCDIFHIKFNV